MPSDASAAPVPSKSGFADRAILACRELGHPLCVGLDPHLDAIPELFRRGGSSGMDPRSDMTAGKVERFLLAVVERLVGRVAVVKPQIAFFEQLGSPGLRALENVMQRARREGLLVLLDAKRGDIGSTAEGYARAYLSQGSRMPADAITLNPYLGLDTLEPFANYARTEGSGLFVLAKTSNPGSGDFQDRLVDGRPLYASVASALSPLCAELRGEKTGWSSLGVVVGATYPEQADAIREALPDALFLVPGFGAQGGSAEAAVRGFRRGPNGLEGGLVNSSRAITFPEGARDLTDLGEWERLIDDAIDRAIETLGAAVA